MLYLKKTVYVRNAIVISMSLICLLQQDVVKILNNYKLVNNKLNYHSLKYKSIKRKERDLIEVLKNLAARFINYAEYDELPKENILIEQLLDVL